MNSIYSAHKNNDLSSPRNKNYHLSTRLQITNKKLFRLRTTQLDTKVHIDMIT